MNSMHKMLPAAFTLSIALAVTACGAGGDETGATESSVSAGVDKRGADADSSDVIGEGKRISVCDAGTIEPVVPEGEEGPVQDVSTVNPAPSDDEIVPKLPECRRDDIITPRYEDEHGCLSGAICFYKEADFKGPVATLDTQGFASIAHQFRKEGDQASPRDVLFSDGTQVGDQASSIVNNSEKDAEFFVDAGWKGGGIKVAAHSSNSNLAEWGVNDVITSMLAS
ncbi:peptidase inhibitor family I36 protein [Streptomyces sp. NPDC090106]|uniref:peptidase inhibitor family I36 protein n=1 Tax=Streptomyces sp. NPDC090106 TaxID=3365946 RepID=UPI00382025C0